MDRGMISIKTKQLFDEYKIGEDVILTYQIQYPHFEGPVYQMALRILNRFYENQANEFQNYIANELYPQAKEQYAYSKENGYPVIAYEAMTTFEPTYSKACIVSLYMDRYEFTGGAHGSTTRSSQTWNLQGGRQIALEELFGCDLDVQSYILNRVRSRIALNPQIYFDNAAQLAEENFHPESFYCTTQGIVVYYQQYDIAPYSSGIRSFLIPYTHCVHSPKTTCFVLHPQDERHP